jgi:excisionase family DNA binding protein
MAPDQFVSQSEAARRLGISRITLRRRLRERGIVTYRSQVDFRPVLIRKADVERLAQPVPHPTRKPAVA